MEEQEEKEFDKKFDKQYFVTGCGCCLEIEPHEGAEIRKEIKSFISKNYISKRALREELEREIKELSDFGDKHPRKSIKPYYYAKVEALRTIIKTFNLSK